MSKKGGMNLRHLITIIVIVAFAVLFLLYVSRTLGTILTLG